MKEENEQKNNKENIEQLDDNEDEKIKEEDDFPNDEKKKNNNNKNENENQINKNNNQNLMRNETIYEMTRLNDFETSHDFIFRICIVGECNVGKTSLLTRFCDNTFKESYNNTIGVDFRVVTLKYQNMILKLHIWDTAGQERFKSIALNYFRSSHGFMFVYDISKENSFNNIQQWIDLAFSNSKHVGINFLVGNKCDLENERTIQRADAEKFAKEKNLIFFETSAKTNENVEKIFIYFTYKLINYFSENKDQYINNDTNKTKLTNNAKDIETKEKKNSNCSC